MKKIDTIIIIGAGGHARSSIDIIEGTKKFKIIGCLDKKYPKIKKLLKYNILGDDNKLSEFLSIASNAFIGVGQIKSPLIRISLFKHLKKIGFKLPTIISKNSKFSNYSKVGESSILFNLTIVSANTKIGTNCIINNSAIIEHDCVINNNCHISTGVIINGNVIVGENSFIGSGTIIRNNLNIGKNVVIGAGNYIKENIPDGAIIK